MANTQVIVDIVGRETVSAAAGSAGAALGGLAGHIGGVERAFVSAAAAAARMAAATAAIGIGAVAAGMGSAITAAAGFEKQISAIAAVSGATKEQLAGISQVALQLGKDTSYSAAEAAKGMEEMVKSGVSLDAVMKGGAAAMLNLAAASGTEVPRAAEVMSNAMNVFKIGGEQAAHVADVLTQVSNASSTSIHELGYSFAAGGAAAKAAGISFEDTATTFALLAEAGIKGSDAGTAFKTAVLNLAPSSKEAAKEMRNLGIITADGANQFFTAEGNAKGMADIAQVLQTSLQGLSKEQQILALKTMFGTDAFRLAQVMMEQGAAGYARMNANMAESGNAADSARTRLANLAGSMEMLKGSIETVSIMFGTPFLAPLKRVADGLTEVVNRAEPFITALGTRMAAGLDQMIDRVIAAAPQFRRFGEMIGEGIAVAQSYAATLLEMARGFDFGGAAENAVGFVGALTGALQQLAPIAQAVGRAFVDNLTETFRFLTTAVLPPVMSMAQQFGALLTGTLLPAAAQVGATVRSILGPTLAWLADTVFPPLMSIVKQTTDFFTGVMLPTFPAIAAAIRATLGPTIQWLATDVWPRLTAAATVAWQFIAGTIIPALPGLAAQLRTLLGGALQWLADTGWPALVKGATVAWDFLQNKVIPVVQDVIKWLRENLPAAIQTVTETFEALRGRVQPIIEQVFSGDIKGALLNLGAAFADFATLALGWLSEQVSQIDWAAVWAAAVDIGTQLGTYLLGLTVDFLSWLKAQVALIDWAAVWASAVTIATSLATYVLGLTVDFLSWLRAQVALVDWAQVWASAVTIATALGTYLLGLVIDFATWLKAEVAKIPWAEVWATATAIATALGTYLLGLTIDFVTWLKAEVAKIPWAEVWATATTAGTELFRWLQQLIMNVPWATLGKDLGTYFGTMFSEGMTNTDWQKIGQDTAKLLGQMLATAITAQEAWMAFKQGVIDGFSQAITGTSQTEGINALSAWLDGVIKGAWDKAIGAFTPSKPSWWPDAVPWPFGGGGGAAPAGGGGGGRQGTTTPETGAFSSNEERIAYARASAIRHGHDPDVAERVARAEGAGPAGPIGDQGTSFGAYQLHVGGGLGDRFQRETGLDPRDLANERAMIDWTMRNLEQTGWSPYHGAAPAGVTGRTGIGVAPPQPREQRAPGGGAPGEEMVTYQDQWGNIFTTTRSKFNQRPGGNADVTVIGTQQPMGGVAPMGGPAYSLPIQGMGPAQPHWGANPGGTDIFAPAGTPIQSIGAGTVTGAGNFGPGGYAVMVRGDDGLEYYYAHMQDAPPVQKGQRVEAGQVIGAVGNTGNAAGTPSHLHLGIGESILSGTGPAGGTGSNFNAVQFLNDIRDGKYNPGIQKLADDVDLAGEAFGHVNEQTAATTPELSAIGAAIDPVVAAFDTGTTSVGGMTDAIIASAAEQGVATESSAAYSAGLIGQDEAMRGVLAGFAETTPAAAELLAQMDAGTISTDQAAVAFAGLSTSTAVATGAIQTMGTEGTAAAAAMDANITASGDAMEANLLASAANMEAGVTASGDLMELNTVTSGDTMEKALTASAALMDTNVSASGDAMESSISTATDLMEGNASGAADTMQANVVDSADTMNTEGSAAVDELKSSVETAMGDAEGAATTSAETMETNVTTAADTVNTEAGGAIEVFSQTAETEFGNVETAAGGAKTALEELGKNVDIPAPDTSEVVDAIEEIEEAAKDAEKAVQKLATSIGKVGGEVGGGSGKSPFGKNANALTNSEQTAVQMSDIVEPFATIMYSALVTLSAVNALGTAIGHLVIFPAPGEPVSGLPKGGEPQPPGEPKMPVWEPPPGWEPPGILYPTPGPVFPVLPPEPVVLPPDFLPKLLQPIFGPPEPFEPPEPKPGGFVVGPPGSRPPTTPAPGGGGGVSDQDVLTELRALKGIEQLELDRVTDLLELDTFESGQLDTLENRLIEIRELLERIEVGVGLGTQQNFNMTVHSQATREPLEQDFAILAARARSAT